MGPEISDFYLKTRRVFLYRTIEPRVALNIVKQLKFFANTSDLPISIYINSGGGDLDSAKAIMDEVLAIRKADCEIWTIATGLAASAAADILILGTPGKRYASSLSSIMLHPMSVGLSHDYQKVQEKAMSYYGKDNDILEKLIATACGKGSKRKFEQFKKDIDKSLWLTAQEAIKYGVIDKIWDYDIEGQINEKINIEQ